MAAIKRNLFEPYTIVIGAVTDKIRVIVAFLWESESSCRGLDGFGSLVTIGQIAGRISQIYFCLFSVAREVSEGDDRLLTVILFSLLLIRLVSVLVSMLIDVRKDTHARTHTPINQSFNLSISSVHRIYLDIHTAVSRDIVLTLFLNF